MCERNAFYIQASCLCLEANSLRDIEQSAGNITIYQVSLSQYVVGPTAMRPIMGTHIWHI